ncbi:MAG: ATP-dependent DNA helicase RecG [Christensenellales bacterium]|jgi:ATP-dependent DNA helicase RecG
MTPLQTIKGLGAARIKLLSEAGIESVEDLLLRFPVGYRDMTNIRPLSTIRAGEAAALRVRVSGTASVRRASRLTIVSCWVTDDTDMLKCIWFNQPWIAKELRDERELLLYARADVSAGTLVLQSPVIETEMRISPIYKPIAGIAQKTLARIVESALDRCDALFPETLPETLLETHSLCGRALSVRTAHFPQNKEDLACARRRLAFENMLLYQVGLALSRAIGDEGIAIPCTAADEAAFWKTLPYAPTKAQVRTLHEIAQDLAAPHAMARLVQGDVGSGKTAVAFGALYMAAKHGFQGALMAPTEILAAQHFESAKETLEPLGIRCGLLTGSLTQKQHLLAHEAIAQGEWQVVIGTHALVTERVEYRNLGLVITDEQHRFGVRQRTLLGAKGEGSNVLVMSATPIPRTMALILYGDLDISVIDEMPPGRKPVRTRIVPAAKREDMYGFLWQEAERGRQIYVVCPLVEESEAVDAEAAEQVFLKLRDDKLKGLRVEMVHGRMKASDKDAILTQFHAGEVDVLVSTTVIEVGVNVPNASVMVIEDAQRFGLAQLHQLRGRVGRGKAESWCFLMGEPNERLKLLTQTNDGFLIAQRDMEMRGAGDIFGLRQTGLAGDGALSADADAALLKETHDAAWDILKRPRDADAMVVIALAKETLESRLAEAGVN